MTLLSGAVQPVGDQHDALEMSRIRVIWDAGVTQLILNRPERRNAIDLVLAQEFLEACLMERTAASRCILLTGAGPHFCVGGDLKSFQQQSNLPNHLLEVTSYLHAAIARLVAIPAPLVVAAQGHVAGAGLGLACLADILLTEEGATFRTAYGALGLTPDASTSYMLPRLIGLRRAQQMALLGYVVAAEEAVQWGLCSEVVPAGELLTRARSIAKDLANGPNLAYGHTSRLLRTAYERGLTDHLDDESMTLKATAATAHAAEGIAAFVERRSANFN
ncbi:MAG TPA: enoyl-CoA hydratase/isomerase family protein [Micromonosporaceae bacterium]|nr:enoyl-CoA hydratase/isomerase family protein [Micromonosporaceae bacterium]